MYVKKIKKLRIKKIDLLEDLKMLQELYKILVFFAAYKRFS